MSLLACLDAQEGASDQAKRLCATPCLSTATKWGLDTLDAMTRLFTTGAWLPPALTPDTAAAA